MGRSSSDGSSSTSSHGLSEGPALRLPEPQQRGVARSGAWLIAVYQGLAFVLRGHLPKEATAPPRIRSAVCGGAMIVLGYVPYTEPAFSIPARRCSSPSQPRPVANDSSRRGTSRVRAESSLDQPAGGHAGGIASYLGDRFSRALSPTRAAAPRHPLLRG